MSTVQLVVGKMYGLCTYVIKTTDTCQICLLVQQNLAPVCPYSVSINSVLELLVVVH